MPRATGEEVVTARAPPSMDPVHWGNGPEVYRGLQASFDQLAPSYDEDIGGNLIGSQMREEFRRAIVAEFPPGSKLFEIGCGTGSDALWLARQGSRVVATDISDAMLSRLEARARVEGLSERIACRRLAARDVGELAREFGERAFDGGYCHAGALNMEPELVRVPEGIRRLLRPGGAFVCSLINKTSLFEILFYPLVLRPRKAFRRLGNVVPLPISRKPPLNRNVVPARFYSPSDAARIFREGFSLASVRGVRIVLPPANLTDEYARYRTAFLALERIEHRLASMPLLRSSGHHSILVFRKK